jgi:predicted SAM-dependent methyltransferase
MIELHLGCGVEIKESALNVDIHKLNGVDLICDLNNRWPFRSGSVDKITANHVFEHLDYDLAFGESARVLKPNGTLEITLPMGMNARADVTHRWEMVWDMPEHLTDSRHWDTKQPLCVVERSIELHSHLPGIWRYISEGILHIFRCFYADGRWLFDIPFTSGNFRIKFVKSELKMQSPHDCS